MLIQNVDWVRSRIKQLAVNTFETEEADFVRFRVQFNKTANRHGTNATDDELAEVTEYHRGVARQRRCPCSG